MLPQYTPLEPQHSCSRALRCQECKHTFDEPEDSEGKAPRPHEDIVCPGCQHRTMRLWYAELPQKQNLGTN